MQSLEILDEEKVTYDLLCSIGKGGAYAKKREYEEELKKLSEETTAPVVEEIRLQEPNMDNQTFDGGFDEIVRWYNNKFVNNTNHL